MRVSSRAGLPSLLVYLLMGVALGESVLGIPFENAELAHALGFGALAVILAEGGLTTSWREVSPSIRLGVALATVGVTVSVGVVAVGAHYLLGLPWELAVLLGAVTSPTDAAAVFSVLRVVPLPKRITGALEAESGLNDAPTVVLVTLISTGAAAEHGLFGLAAIIVFELVAGVADRPRRRLRRRLDHAPRRAPVPPASTRSRCSAWRCWRTAPRPLSMPVRIRRGLRRRARARQRELPHRAAARVLRRGPRLARPDRAVRHARPAAVAGPDRPRDRGAGARGRPDPDLVARPLSVLVSSLVQRMSWRELAFISWAGLRGAVPIVLATIPLAEEVDQADLLFDIVFVLVVIYTLLTGPTLPWVAKVLRVARRSEPRDIELEAAPLDRVAADMLQVAISPKSRLHGVEIGELRLPAGALGRADRARRPDARARGRTVLKHGDDLLVVTPRKLRDAPSSRCARSVPAAGSPNGSVLIRESASAGALSRSCDSLHKDIVSRPDA